MLLIDREPIAASTRTARPAFQTGTDHDAEQRMGLVMLRFDNVAVPREERPKARRTSPSRQHGRKRAGRT
jgi:hypothetical protein